MEGSADDIACDCLTVNFHNWFILVWIFDDIGQSLKGGFIDFTEVGPFRIADTLFDAAFGSIRVGIDPA